MKAMILAAGRGERMRPLTDATPKPMLEAGGKPLIAWTLDALARAWLERNRHQRLASRRAHRARAGRRAANGASHIRYSREAESALETAGGIANALPLLGAAPFLVVNGDIHTRLSISHRSSHAHLPPPATLAHLVLIDNPTHHPAGDFALVEDA